MKGRSEEKKARMTKMGKQIMGIRMGICAT
jgi:hypothetical protein